MPEMSLHRAGAPGIEQRIERVRRFNRFYTKQIGLLQEGLLKTPFNLTEARVIYELARQEETTATQLRAELGIDPGYLSRMLARFQKRRLVRKRSSEADRRRSLLSLTDAGREAFAKLNAASHHEIEALLQRLPTDHQSRLLKAMDTIETILGAKPEPRVSYLLRPPQPGDMGWVVHRHGVLYAQEYGWDETFEALVAKIAAEYARNHDPRKERCWIAEKDGEAVGSVFLVKSSATVARLRLLLVEPSARGLGIGTRLVDECIRFARQAGYRRLTLWTNNVLHAARHIYEEAGFTLVKEEPHHSFGHNLVGETWELRL